ncbi:Cytoskeleton-associated protein 2-like protein [Tupaia chinensis]|uniref:Cytoskeleton-associated protein 2-like protein n=1 Tax=Tupaia chinensis TaxID=246437 RepID=L9JM76_TUPCH|nr:Cytoskeleton-associated protein 2-like protein [Tupaia chinensis]
MRSASASIPGATFEEKLLLRSHGAARIRCRRRGPYLKAKNNCPNPPPPKSTIRPKKDVTHHVVLPVKTTQPVSIKLQPRTANITGSQKPKLEPPKLVGKGLTSGCVSSMPNGKRSSRTHHLHEGGSSTAGELSRKPVGLLNMQELKPIKQQVTDQGNAKCIDSVDSSHVENQSSDIFLKEMNKENLSQTLLEPERKPDPESCAITKTKTNSHNPIKGSLAPKQAMGKSPVNSAVLKDRVNKQLVGETQIRTLPVKSQQLSKGAGLTRPGEKHARTVPSHHIQTFNRTQVLKKPVVKDIKVSRSKYKELKETKSQSYLVNEQKVKTSKPRIYPNLPQSEYGNKHPNVKENQKSSQPYFRPPTSCALQRSKAISQRSHLTTAKFNSVIPSTPSISADGTNGNKYNNFQQKAQTLDSKLKKTIPQNHFLNKTAPKTQAGRITINRKGVLNETQTNPDTKKKPTAEDRRKQLEEWQKSKGKIYKRPPMELKTKRKVKEEMNISCWKSIEKEEEDKKAQLELSNKINNTLSECLQLIEGGVSSNEIFTILSSIPEAEKFAKFWICKAKLLAHKGSFDVIGLYEEAIKNGATPIQELREVVLNILQDLNRNEEEITSDCLVAETNKTSVEELVMKMESEKPCLSPKEREQVVAVPQITKAEPQNHPGIKLQIASIPSLSGMPEVQDMKLITPVRRSARIERAVSRYPEMLQEHDLVVASLDELLEVEDTECFIFRKNEALPVTLGFQVLES